MKKSVVTHIVVMIVAVLLGAYLASTIMTQKAALSKNMEEISQAPLGGFNKFASDVQWMLFINYCGGLESINKDNVGEVYGRLKSILANDPNFEAAYGTGGLMLSVRDPEKAAEILVRGAENPNLSNNWELPFWAGHVLANQFKGGDAKETKERLLKAEEMFRLALSRNSSASHVASALLRTRAKILQNNGVWNGIPLTNDKHAYLCAVYDEWRNNGGTELDGGVVVTGGGNDALGISDIKERLLKAAQEAKASSPEDKNILKTVDTVMKRVLEDEHLCQKCLSVYAPGDKFCTHCGTQVKVYGVCPKCGSVLKGEFCSNCGFNSKNDSKADTKK